MSNEEIRMKKMFKLFLYKKKPYKNNKAKIDLKKQKQIKNILRLQKLKIKN